MSTRIANGCQRILSNLSSSLSKPRSTLNRVGFGRIRYYLVGTLAATICTRKTSSYPLSTRFRQNSLDASSRSFSKTLSYPSFVGQSRSYSGNTSKQHGTSATQSESARQSPLFRRGDKIQVEVSYFGVLGASVEVLGRSHEDDSLIGEEEPALGSGLILQSEIRYFRLSRKNVDVVQGEILPAFVENVRPDGKLDISLRPPGFAKANILAKEILERLQSMPGGALNVGDKSSPSEIDEEFPGVSKSNFKKAVATLYKQKKVTPSPYSVKLV